VHETPLYDDCPDAELDERCDQTQSPEESYQRNDVDLSDDEAEVLVYETPPAHEGERDGWRSREAPAHRDIEVQGVSGRQHQPRRQSR
jgi:hypothetical protein